MIGQRLGQYEIVEELGRGGMATVYRAYHPQMERFVAVKIIHAALAQGEEGMERFKQEARLIARLEHPHLLPVYDYDPEHQPPYIVMRYLEGGTLKEVIEAKQSLPLHEVAYVMRQITSALDYAHRNGVIHRDIKPSNIMIDADGNAYLTDFGIARILGESGVTQTGFAVGTPGYMSPEQGMGVANIDGRTDVYALGVMAYEMATGQAPYQGETPMAVLMQHIQAPLPFATLTNPDLPEAFDEVVQKALAKDPDERYETPGDFATALSGLVDSSEIATTPQNLRTVAVKAIKQIQEDRDTQALDKIMSEFKGTRSTGMRAVAKPGDATKLVDFSDPKQPAASQTNWTLIGGIAIVVVAIIAGGFFWTTQTQNANATASAEAQALINTSEARTQAAIMAASSTSEVRTEIADAAQAQQSANATATELAKPTEPPTRGPSPTPSPTPRFAGLQALRELSVRTGPSSAYRELRSISAGEQLEIVGQNGRWYQVLLPTGTTGWVLNSPLFVDSFGPLDNVPVVEAATITPTTTNTPDRAATQTIIERLTQNARSTANAEATSEQATENVQATATGRFNATLTREAQATENAVATENAIGTQNAISTANAQATNEQATENAMATQNAIGTQNAIIEQNALGTANALATSEQETINAIATQDAIAAANALATSNVIATQVAQETQIALATISALPGRLPYLEDFEDGQSVLVDSTFTGDGWSIGRGAGESSVLIGSARVSEAFILLGNPQGGSPEWVETGLNDFVFSFRVNMTAQEGVHVVFRYTPNRPYYALDIAPGRINVRRGESNNNPETDRESEKFIGFARGYTTTMELDDWYDITVWIQGQHIYVFVDNDLVADALDDNSPRPGGGDILFQTLNRTKDIYFDDVIVQRASPASDHFESSRFSSSWNPSVSTGEVGISDDEQDDDNRYVRMWRGADLTAEVNIADLDMRTRIYSEQGGYALYLRESDAGSIRLRLDGGNLTVSRIDESGSATTIREVENFYNRIIWEDLRIRYVGDNLTIWINGERELNTTLNTSLPAGHIRFETAGTGATADILRVDDFLLLESIR